MTKINLFSLVIFSLVFLLTSCNQIQPDNKKVSETSQKPTPMVNKTETYECWIVSCNEKDALFILKESGNLQLPDLEYYKKRFWVLIDRYKTFETLVSAPDYQKFVTDINIEFFNCSWDFRYCESKEKKYDEETMNYLFYMYLPQMVIEEYSARGVNDMLMIEDVIQSIKRQDYTIREIKDSVIEKFASDIDKKYEKIDLSYIDKEKLKNDSEYFKDIVLWKWDWLFYKIRSEVQNVSLNRISEEQMEQLLNHTYDVFFHQLEKLWIKKDEFYSKISKEEIEKEIKNKVNAANTKYNLNKLLPNNRFLRNDELYIFNKNNISKFEKQAFWDAQFLSEMTEIRDLSYLLAIVWNEENLFFYPNLVKELKFENNYLYLNLFDYLKQIKYNVVVY